MKCDTTGYSMLLKDHKCTISDPHGKVLGQVPLTGGLYQHQYMFQAHEIANVAHKALSLDQLHWKMGHISPHATKELVNNGTVTGLNLDVKNGFSDLTKVQKGRDRQRKDVEDDRQGKALKEGCRERRWAQTSVSPR